MPKATHVPITSRRALLASAALVAPALALPTVAMAGGEPDPDPAWFAEWRALVDWCNGPHADGDEELQDDPQWRRVLELERLVAETRARTLGGAAAQVRLACGFMATYRSLGDGVNDEALLTNALAILERLAGEARHV